MFIGLRAPAPQGDAFVVRIAEQAIFGQDAGQPTVFRVRLGQDDQKRDLGIRDLATVSDGFLILAGPSLPEGDDAVGGGAVFHWPGGTEPVRRLQDAGLRAVGVKPEGLLVLGEDASAYRVLVLHDGPPGGAPTEYRIPRR